MNKEIIKHWSNKFGIPIESFDKKGIIIESSKLNKNEKIINIFKTATNCIVVLPYERASELAALISNITLSSKFKFEDIYSKFEDKIDKIIGPIYQGYKVDDSLYDDAEGVLIEEIDSKTIDFFNSELNEHDKMILGNFSKPIFAINEDNKIVSLSHYLFWTDKVISVGILTHPKYRKQGYSKKVLKLAMNHATDNGYDIAYQTLDNNLNSKLLASSLGIKEYATTLKVYLKSK
ncbi:MAG: GNAT family N-acetyltransferase [Candidatus Delongbacteria bacterium]|jgi:RimJ/RimL family protein N-acetyltransferase|nr:GNAT family N-acetyltransferase [Candidatus Delongbacteria bacterium]